MCGKGRHRQVSSSKIHCQHQHVKVSETHLERQKEKQNACFERKRRGGSISHAQGKCAKGSFLFLFSFCRYWGGKHAMPCCLPAAETYTEDRRDRWFLCRHGDVQPTLQGRGFSSPPPEHVQHKHHPPLPLSHHSTARNKNCNVWAVGEKAGVQERGVQEEQ